VRRQLQILFVFIFFTLSALEGYSKHIKGGEIHYSYLGPSPTKPNYDQYELRLRLFVSCSSTLGQLEDTAHLGIYRTRDGFEIDVVTVTLNVSYQINLKSPSPCIINPSPVCYWIREFTAIVDLPKDPDGYMVVFQRCCRIDGIRNLSPNINVGASYICQIQGTSSIGITGENSNPDFGVKDTVLICQGKRFKLDYHATDVDGDSLSYEFAPGYYGGGINNPVVANPGPPRSWQALAYSNGFSGLQPLGRNVTINALTGLISGIAPSGGDYVVCVLVREWRAGVQVSAHRKDFIIHIDDRCDFPSADLDPTYITCNGFDFSFHNEASNSPLIHTYFWDFGVPSATGDTSTQSTPTFTFPDTGVYKVKFIVNKDEACTDSATTLMSVFPGFFPGFTSLGTCILNPVLFTDTTKTKYGRVSSWAWNFGDRNTSADTSNQQNPSWLYSDTGMKNVQFIVANSKGCKDTVYEQIHLTDKPPIFFPFRDTLICDIDTLQLHAQGYGTFTWSPPAYMINPNTADPLVYPQNTTWYSVTLNQAGCINNDSVLVRVVDHVTLNPGNDSTICLGDTITLNPSGDGLYFLWSPAASLDNPNVKNPNAFPFATTTYYVKASIGKCNTTGSVNIRTVPYPLSNAGSDVFICYQDTAQLEAFANGIRFNWIPATYLSDPAILNPLAFPPQTTVYQLLAYDTLGCPKPGISKITVSVNPPIIAFAGNDTSVVVGQPLQLHGSGAPAFLWLPDVALNRNDISDPVAMLNSNQTYAMKTFTEEGCFGYDTINIKVFTTAPDIFVPNAFTPGGSANNIFRPIPVGISKMEYFRVYNRNGMLLYSTSEMGVGWDGTYNGKSQNVGGYVWMVQGIDYTGKVVSRKGIVVLVR
jgi:gliding motility-associated-like protein